ncbi:MAG: hypothetical protein JOZ78_16450 [Chroococcidiopsidaceae cyanobacterium CP_BM_ER_R8_30]|nr:hypothetical protein [Chroococcidiopsidaceae cyanobacterium CP_BM_ER_R8_30]
MNLSEFEAIYRLEIEKISNQLQAAILLLAELNNSITLASQNLNSLTLIVEEFIIQQKGERSPPT